MPTTIHASLDDGLAQTGLTTVPAYDGRLQAAQDRVAGRIEVTA